MNISRLDFIGKYFKETSRGCQPQVKIDLREQVKLLLEHVVLGQVERPRVLTQRVRADLGYLLIFACYK